MAFCCGYVFGNFGVKIGLLFIIASGHTGDRSVKLNRQLFQTSKVLDQPDPMSQTNKAL